MVVPCSQTRFEEVWALPRQDTSSFWAPLVFMSWRRAGDIFSVDKALGKTLVGTVMNLLLVNRQATVDREFVTLRGEPVRSEQSCYCSALRCPDICGVLRGRLVNTARNVLCFTSGS